MKKHTIKFVGNDPSLAFCTTCKGVWGTLTTECCGQPLTPEHEKRILEYSVDFRFGKWLVLGKTRVVNINRESCDVSIMRGLGYGNKYVVGVDGDRFTCIRKFREDFNSAIQHGTYREKIRMLQGLRIGCVCKPKSCHGDVYVEWLRQFER